jgi:hypothetical protein
MHLGWILAIVAHCQMITNAAFLWSLLFELLQCLVIESDAIQPFIILCVADRCGNAATRQREKAYLPNDGTRACCRPKKFDVAAGHRIH